jgi:hypothetical protein
MWLKQDASHHRSCWRAIWREGQKTVLPQRHGDTERVVRCKVKFALINNCFANNNLAPTQKLRVSVPLWQFDFKHEIHATLEHSRGFCCADLWCQLVMKASEC